MGDYYLYFFTDGAAVLGVERALKYLDRNLGRLRVVEQLHGVIGKLRGMVEAGSVTFYRYCRDERRRWRSWLEEVSSRGEADVFFVPFSPSLPEEKVRPLPGVIRTTQRGAFFRLRAFMGFAERGVDTWEYGATRYVYYHFPEGRVGRWYAVKLEYGVAPGLCVKLRLKRKLKVLRVAVPRRWEQHLRFIGAEESEEQPDIEGYFTEEGMRPFPEDC